MALIMRAPVLHTGATQLVSCAELPDNFASPGIWPLWSPLHRVAGKHWWMLGKGQTPVLSFGLG